ncbi:ABC transporter permease [Moraxella sp. ZY210820]|uniref:ABC transporter permease n=1 Tax=unclassified Moraxella TaxID=2685852 RepID=UPI002731D696|nr:FtsX-like permease family protein [Moraxella sp. ZY210820]WLF82914.1 FtsX-like permease family protein [Moraxella sp. ZY210820]
MLRLFSSLFRQSLHSGGIVLFIIALVLAISATTALKFSNQQLQTAINQQAGELIASDMVLSSTNPLEPTWKTKAHELHLTTSEVTLFSSMARANDQFTMVNVKAIDRVFPLRGKLDIQPEQSIQQGEIWLSPRLFDILKVKLGEHIFIADGEFKITGEIIHDANQEIGLSGFSPSVIIHRDDIAKTNAIQVGSRIDYRLLMAGTPTAIQQFEQQYKNNLQSPMRLRLANDSNTRLMKPIKNLELYMQLANLLTLLLCGIAIALTCQRYIRQQQEHIAMIRCLGASRGQIMATFSLLLVVVGVIATVIGTLLGIAFGYVLLHVVLNLFPYLNLEFSFSQMMMTILPNAFFTCLMVLCGFVLPSIIHLSKVPPMQVLRQGQFKGMALWGIMLTGLMSLTLFTFYLTQNVNLTLSVMGALSVLCLVLFSLMWLILKALKKLPHLEQWLREPAKISLQMTALALGLSLMSVLFLLKNDLIDRWQQQFPADTPNQFVYGLPPFDKDALEQVLADKNWYRTPLYPNIRGRLIAKNGQAFSDDLLKNHGALRRELNLTQTEQFPKDNQIVLGEQVFKSANQVSVEQNIAQELNIKIGDELTFSLPEGDITAQVISLRSVEWESFSPNFFFIFSPQTFDENAGSYLGSFHLPKADESEMSDIIQQFPTTVFVDIQGIFEQVKRIVTLLSQLVSLLAFLVLSAGILVLLACLNLLMDERRHEVALLRAIGMSQAQLKRYLTIEMASIGLGAGLMSIIFAEIVSFIVAMRMEHSWQLHWQYWLILPIVMMLLCGLIGRYRLRKLWQIAPLLSLRNLS